MSNIKERILGAITVMSDEDARTVWKIILNQFSDNAWDNIEIVTPDDIDIDMLKEIDNTPECKEFISSEQLKKELNL